MATTTCPPVRGRQNSIANGVGVGVSAYQQIQQQPTQANNQSQQRKDSHIMDQSEYGMMDSNSDASFQGDFNSQSQNTISQKSSTPPTQSRGDYRNYSVYSPPSASTPSTVFNFAQQQHVILQRSNNNQSSQIGFVQNSQNAPLTQPTLNPYQNVAPPQTPTHHYGYVPQPTQQLQHRNCSPPAMGLVGSGGGSSIVGHAHATSVSPLGGAVGAQLQALLQHHPQLFPQLLRANQQQQNQQKQQAEHEFGLRTRRFHRWVTLTLQNRENLSKLNRDDQFRMICNLSLQALAEEALSR